MATFAQLQAAFYARGYDYMNDAGVGQTAAKAFLNQAYLELCEEELWPFLRTAASGAAPLAIPNLRSIDSVADTTSRQPLHWATSDDLIDQFAILTTTGAPDYFYVDNADEIIQSSSFEAGVDSWTQINFATVFASQVSANATAGSRVLRATGTATNVVAFAPTFVANAGRVYSARGNIFVWVAATAVAAHGSLAFQWDDGSGTFALTGTNGVDIGPGAGARVAINDGAIAPASTVQGRIIASANNVGSTTVDWELDNIVVSQTADIPTVRTYPVGGMLTVRYYRVPAELVADADQAIVPNRFCNLIVDAAVRRAGPEDAPGAAAAAEAERQRGLDLMRRSLMFRDGMRHYQRVTGASGDW